MRELFEAIAHTETKFLLVLGAGVSLDAGLPSWHTLLDNMTSLIANDRWRAAAERDENEPTRKAEYITRLVQETSDDQDYQIVRRALYLNSPDPQPGLLADSLARLVAELGLRVTVITTNFDTLFEKALSRYLATPAAIYSLDTVEDWKNHTGEAVPVLHLHGVLVPRVEPQKPLVLTESEFLAEGKRARGIIAEQLISRSSLFIGVSMTDPNLVGPLWDTKDASDAGRPHNAFMLAVAEASTLSADPHEDRVFSVKRAALLGDLLKLSAICLKSYSQQTQMIYDLSLALRMPDEYLGAPGHSGPLHYGSRFSASLDSCYSAIGIGVSDQMPSGAHGRTLSDELYAAMEGGRNILAAELELLGASASMLEELAAATHALQTERFGVFLWLRAREERGGIRPYAIRLVGSSVYAHREPWSLDREAEIEPASRHIAALALFYGNSKLQNLPQGPEWSLWASGYAVPFTLSGAHGIALPTDIEPYDSITPGAITFNTTRFAIRPKGMEDREWALKRSAMSFARPEALGRLREHLADVANRIVTKPNHGGGPS